MFKSFKLLLKITKILKKFCEIKLLNYFNVKNVYIKNCVKGCNCFVKKQLRL